MREISYGKKYDKALNTTQIAAKFREDVKQAIASGDLPKGVKLSVKTSYFSGGSSIHVKIVAVPCQTIDVEAWLERDDYDAMRRRGSMGLYTEESRNIRAKLNAMLQAYNYDGSDIMTDYFHVRFYGDVEIDDKATAREREILAKGLIDLEAKECGNA